MPSGNRKARISASVVRRLMLHGLPIEIGCDLPELNPTIGRLLGCYESAQFPPESPVTRGCILPYVGAEVARRLPPKAVPLHGPGELTEIYVQDERAWIFDERWGMSEVNLIKGQWKSWIIPQPRMDVVRLTEWAIHRPLAMLLKNRGIHLIPSAAVARDGFAILAISPFGLERELSALMDCRYRIIGQRWTALREEKGQLALLSMPGVVQQRPAAGKTAVDWVDLTASNPLASQSHGICSGIAIIDTGRRARASLTPWPSEDAAMVLRLAWPIPELHPSRRRAQFATRIPQICPCYRVQLSHDPREWVSLVESLRCSAPLRQAA